VISVGTISKKKTSAKENGTELETKPVYAQLANAKETGHAPFAKPVAC